MTPGIPWSTDEDRRLFELAQSGLSFGEIALRINRSRSVIRRHAEKLKIKVAAERNGMTIGRLELGLKGKG